MMSASEQRKAMSTKAPAEAFIFAGISRRIVVSPLEIINEERRKG
jgi:hypothetical protein